MSRTKRSKKHVGYFRAVKTQGTRRTEAFGVDEVRDNGFNPSNRARTRGNPTGSIPDAYDDIHVAARNETDFHRKGNKPDW